MNEHKKNSGGIWSLYKRGGITSAVASAFGMPNAQQMAFIRSVMKEQRTNALFDVPLKELEVIVFDLETTGFYPKNGDEIISIGAVAVKGKEVLEQESFYTLVNPKRKIPKHIVELTGITDEQVHDAPELIKVLGKFLEFINKRLLVAHASSHDKQFLNAALWKTSRIQLTHRVLDTILIAKWLYPKQKSYDLDTLLNMYDIPVTVRHHALEDAKMTAILWTRFIEQILDDKQITTLGDLYAYLSRH
jgi:DNA polymerase-3 subunit epsilon